MTKAELLEIVAGGESSGVEFKRDKVRPEQLAKEIVALANFQGGRVLLGVEDDGSISGVQRPDIERWVMDTVFGQVVHPTIIPYYEEVEVGDGLRVAVITVEQGVTKPYVVRTPGREDVYVRIGSTSRLATREQQAQLFAAGGLVQADLMPVSGSELGDLSKERMEDYLVTFLRHDGPPQDDDAWHQRLVALGFMTERPKGPPLCTVGGLLLFGYRPRRLLRTAGVRWMCFRGTDKDYDALDDQLINGPMVGLWRVVGGGRQLAETGVVERLMDAMRPFVSEETADMAKSFRRERRWHYPPDAMREGVVNALAHRDWSCNADIEVVRYADRVEVTSPGAMPNDMTVAKMIAGQRVSRNTLISDVLRDYGYSDARGMGVRTKIIPLMQQQNGVDPEFEATSGYLKLTLPRRAG